MSEENVEIVRSIYEALNRADWDAAFHNADRDFALTTQVGPAAGTHRGRKEVVAFLEDFRDMFDGLTWEPEEFFDGEDRVVAFVAVCSRPRNSGVDLVVRNGHLWTIHDGAVLSLETFPNRKDALDAAGLSE